MLFIKDAHDLKIELAADYLVMASWLAYLKSRLLLPPAEDEEELSAEDMANRLVFQLQKLESMREAAIQLMNRPQLGKDMFKRGKPEGIRIKRHSQYHASLYDLLGSYSTQRLRNYYSNWKPKELDVFTIERARQRLEHMLGKLDDWDKFDKLILKDIQSAQKRRTMTASSLSAILEFVRDGRMEIHQDKNFGEILVRRARPKAASL